MKKIEITPELIEQTIRFHGHVCPGLAMGIRASELALEIIGHDDDGGVVAIAEADMCAVDAIQYLTGCTLGKGNLIHVDYGKIAFSFFSRSNDKAFRIVLVPTVMDKIWTEMQEYPGSKKLFQEQFNYLMQVEMGCLFKKTTVQRSVPRSAKPMKTHLCANCREGVMESRVRLYDNKTFCIRCFNSVEQKN